MTEIIVLKAEDLKQLKNDIVKGVVSGLKPLLKNQQDEILTVEAVAKYLNVPVSSIYKKTSQNEIPYFKVGHGLRFKKKDIDAWLQGSHVPSWR